LSQILRMDAPVLETEIRVMFFDTDAGKLVHNLAYLRFIETNRSLLAEQLGWDLGRMVDGSECPVVIRTEIDYRRPARLWDRLVIKGWLERYERSRFWCAFEIRRAGQEGVLVRARQMLAVVTLPEMKVVRLPASWDEKYGHLRGRAGANER
jgi:YbgC/YbaW family acyl-CoA thioester hydrolase